MAKPEWGRKVSCTSCGNKFYDMKREPAVCPSCGTENDPWQAFRPKRGAAPKPAAKAEAKPKEVKAAVEDDEEDLDAVLPEVEDDDVDASPRCAAPCLPTVGVANRGSVSLRGAGRAR